jgi:predicted DNA-binding protein YlxM (UPF0122 family)
VPDSDNKYFFSYLADVYGGLLTRRQLEVLRDYADNDYSLAEIAERYGIARQSAKDSIHSAKCSLLAYEEKLGVLAKRSEVAAALEYALRGGAEVSAEEYKRTLHKIKEILSL